MMQTNDWCDIIFASKKNILEITTTYKCRYVQDKVLYNWNWYNEFLVFRDC